MLLRHVRLSPRCDPSDDPLAQPQAVGALISLLPKIDGEIRGDIIRYLAAATGQSLGPATEPWQAWWTQHKGDIELPAEVADRTSDVAPWAAAAQARDSSPDALVLRLVLRHVDPRQADRLRAGHLGKHDRSPDQHGQGAN